MDEQIKSRFDILKDIMYQTGGAPEIPYDTVITDLYNDMWYNKYFALTPETLNTQSDGTSAFTIKEAPINRPRHMEGRAQWTQAEGYDQKDGEMQFDSLGDFGSGFKITQKDLRYDEAVLKRYQDSDALYLMGKTMNTVAEHARGAFSTLSIMASEKMQYGKYLITGKRGLDVPSLQQLPSTAFRKVGTTAWSDPSALIISDMIAIEEKFREEVGNIDFNLSWKMSKKVIPLMLKNDEVKSQLSNLLTIDSGGNIQQVKQNLTKDILMRWFAANTSLISPIEFVDIKQEYIGDTQLVGQTLTETYDPIETWDASLVVLSYNGSQGNFYKGKSEELIGLPDTINVTPMLNGLINIRTQAKNETYVPEMHTQLMMSAGAALTHWNQHWVMDITSTSTSEDLYAQRVPTFPQSIRIE